jgi:pimeloyl-ACP methyl ester carboxylesterase
VKWTEYQSLQRVTVLGDQFANTFLSYVDQGRGEPIILIHGLPTWGYLWHGVMADLAQTHRVLVPDLLGYGYSDKRDRFDRSIARQAEMIDLWMQTIGVPRATIVGHDVGGGVALRLATLHPERVGRLCLVDSVSYDSWPIEAMLQLGHPGAERTLTAPALTALLKLGLKQGFATNAKSELVDGLLAPYATEVGKRSLIRDASALDTNHTMELAPLLPKLQVPTLIVWGEDDRFQPVRYAERLTFDIPGARLVRLRNARHFVMFDDVDTVARELRAFTTMTTARARAPEEQRAPARVLM